MPCHGRTIIGKIHCSDINNSLWIFGKLGAERRLYIEREKLFEMLIFTMYLKIIEIGKVSNMSISATKKDDDDLEISLKKLLSDNIFRNCRKAAYPPIRIIFQYSYRNWYFEQLFSIYIKGTYFPRYSRKAIGLW